MMDLAVGLRTLVVVVAAAAVLLKKTIGIRADCNTHYVIDM